MTTLNDGSAPLFVSEPDTTGQWRLAAIQLLNWGTFQGLHRLPVARKGHLFTGPSGSGKSSVLDAVAAVLTPDKWLRFNVAAQEAGAKGGDRSLMSYVRGAWSREADQYADRVVATFLRPRATWSGILLQYGDGRGHFVSLVRLFHAKGVSTDREALKDAHVFMREPVDLLDFQPYVENGIDARRMKAKWPDATVTTGSPGQFYSRMRRQLGLKSEGSLNLLHKTQSAKNLGTLDQLFRQFMLDRPNTFDRAENAVEQFGELNEAHRHVVELRQQSEHLRRMGEAAARFDAAITAKNEADRVTRLLDCYQDHLTLRLAGEEASTLRGKLAQAQQRLDSANAEHEAARERVRTAQRRQIEAGGGSVDDLTQRIKDAKGQAEATQHRRDTLQQELALAELAVPESAADLVRLQETAERELDTPLPETTDHATLQRLAEARNRVSGLEQELELLRRHRSNIPGELQRVRDELAVELKLPRDVMPFAGELLDVDPEHADWTGAIERVLRPLAITLLVLDDHLPEVRRRIDAKHLRTRLVVESVPPTSPPPRHVAADTSLVYRVKVVDGPFRDWLAHRLADRYDYACVDGPDALAGVSRGVTRAGQVKSGERRFVKDDRFHIDDRRQWVLGSDTQPKIDLLTAELEDARTTRQGIEDQVSATQRARDNAGRVRDVLRRLRQQRWEDVDVAAARRKVTELEGQLNALTTDNAELASAVTAYEEAGIAENAARDEAAGARSARDQLQSRLNEIDTQISEISPRLAGMPELSPQDTAALDERYRSAAGQRRITRATVADTTRKVEHVLQGERDRATGEERNAAEAFSGLATEFKAEWRASAADLSASVDDRAGYQHLLDQILARGLPEHESSFLRLLREKSQEVIGFLLADIRDAPRRVQARIDPVNISLGQSMFDRDRYLHIRVKRRHTDEVRTFIEDMRSIVDGQWDDDDLASAERRFATLAGIMHRLASSDPADLGWRNRCLDTREHVTFMAEERDPSDSVVNVHESSIGLSGGQRQKLVIFCLAAALRYQLTEDEESVPTYGTVVLDEAFANTDAQYTRMAMDVFRLFGFHMILATPQKLLQTIEPYVGAITAVSNPNRDRSRLSNAPITEER